MGDFRRMWKVAAICAALCAARGAQAQTLWTENAENGLTYVIDNTDASYPLIQSDVVVEGSNAFHLAHPVGQDNWFTIDQTLTIQSNTKLFFLSRLRSATPTQIARVQVSTDNGSTWPTLYNQAGSGSGTGGEGAFTLKEVDLASYANQNLRFRFYYDQNGGSYFPQTSSAVGWFVDNIQVGSEFAKLPWSIGDPSPHAQLYLEYVNRARADALVEAARLANETDADVVSAYNSFPIVRQDIVEQFNWCVDNGAIALHAQPLSFQENLLTAAELHTQDMYTNQFQGHFSSNNPPTPFAPGAGPGERVSAVGYDIDSLGENVYSYADSVVHGHAGFDVDWGDTSNPASPFYNPDFVGQHMQNPAGHRLSIHNPSFKEIGIGVVNGTNGSVGPQLVTQDFGTSGDVRYVTGVVYEDLNANSFYDLGEGRSGVRVDVDGAAYFAMSSSSGGYSVPVPMDGSYSVTFSGGGFESFSTTATILGGRNVKVDYLAIELANLPGDFNHDNVVDAADYTVWRDGLGSQYTLTEYDDWKSHFGQTSSGGTGAGGSAAVPEPAASMLAFATSFLALLFPPRSISWYKPSGLLS
ncbi:MAG: CAP domain-containing protein [Pirellulales bacterium]